MEKQLNIVFKEKTKTIAAPSGFSELLSTIGALFRIPAITSYKLYYEDKDKDIIVVTDQQDYELAIKENKRVLTFYIADTTESAKEIIEAKPDVKKSGLKARLKFEPVRSLSLSENESQEEMKSSLVYSCLNCNGRKTTPSGTKWCKFCEGTGQIPEALLEKIRESIRVELKAEFGQSVAAEIQPAKKTATRKSEQEKCSVKRDAEVISESMGDNHEVELGVEFEKVWTVKNSGTESWPKSTEFKKVWGDNLQATASSVGEVRPGESAVIKLVVKPPESSGHYFVLYRLTCNNNEPFGEITWIDFAVKESENSSAPFN